MPSHHLDDNSFSFEFLAEFLAAFDFGGFVPADGLLFSFGSYEHKLDDASFLFSVDSYVGFGNHCRRSVVQTASIAEGVSKNPVGIVAFYDQG
jgi:hypothetical protein